ncbi:hypothetical protein HOD08_04010 [bacterium]|nr:hypothetical protein [bacterium]
MLKIIMAAVLFSVTSIASPYDKACTICSPGTVIVFNDNTIQIEWVIKELAEDCPEFQNHTDVFMKTEDEIVALGSVRENKTDVLQRINLGTCSYITMYMRRNNCEYRGAILLWKTQKINPNELMDASTQWLKTQAQLADLRMPKTQKRK